MKTATQEEILTQLKEIIEENTRYLELISKNTFNIAKNTYNGDVKLNELIASKDKIEATYLKNQPKIEKKADLDIDGDPDVF